MQWLRNSSLIKFRKLAFLTGLFLIQPGLAQPIFNITTLNSSLNASLGGTLGITYNVQNTSDIVLTHVAAQPPAGTLLSPATTCRGILASNASCEVVLSVTSPVTMGEWLLNPVTVCAFGGAICSASNPANQTTLNVRPSNLYTEGLNNVFVASTTSKSVVASIPVGSLPSDIAILPNGTKAYVANNGSDNVSVFNTMTNAVVATVALAPGSAPSLFFWSMAVSPDGTKVYVPNEGTDNVAVIDAANDTLLTTIAVGDRPSSVVFTPDGSKAYVGNLSGESISVIDTVSNTVINTIALSGRPRQLQVSPAGDKLYAALQNSNNITVIDTAANSIITTIPLSDTPRYMALVPAKNRLYTANNDGTIGVIDTITNTLVAALFQHSSFVLAVTPSGRKLYVPGNSGVSEDLYVFDTASNMLITQIPDSTGDNLIFNGTADRLYLSRSNRIRVVNTRNDTAEEPIITTGSLGDVIAISP